jgi:hypothetical protein
MELKVQEGCVLKHQLPCCLSTKVRKAAQELLGTTNQEPFQPAPFGQETHSAPDRAHTVESLAPP